MTAGEGDAVLLRSTTQGRRRRGGRGGLTPALVKIESFDPPQIRE